MLLLVQYTLVFASVLMLVALGGCFSEHSGVINLGLEGIMVIGALGGALMMRYAPEGTVGFPLVILTLIAAIVFAMAYSSLLGVACINFKADQTIVGTALNLMGTAGATVIVKAINTAEDVNNVSSTIQYIDQKKSFIVKIGDFEFSWFMLIAFIGLAIAYIVLYKTKFGLRLMACGEHPQAADSVGINVYKMRYAGVMISGALAGIGGLAFTVAAGSGFSSSVAGYGFLALAVMIFGNWKPLNILGASMFFALFKVIGSYTSSISFLPKFEGVANSGYIYNMLPYIVTMIILILTSKNSAAPKAEGIPYDKGQR